AIGAIGRARQQQNRHYRSCDAQHIQRYAWRAVALVPALQLARGSLLLAQWSVRCSPSAARCHGRCGN
ncbi:hypothetical protein HAX54_013706, partial [Datura stramonium]|nr:hypothetical protein [Datura stramonium]